MIGFYLSISKFFSKIGNYFYGLHVKRLMKTRENTSWQRKM